MTLEVATGGREQGVCRRRSSFASGGLRDTSGRTNAWRGCARKRDAAPPSPGRERFPSRPRTGACHLGFALRAPRYISSSRPPIRLAADGSISVDLCCREATRGCASFRSPHSAYEWPARWRPCCAYLVARCLEAPSCGHSAFCRSAVCCGSATEELARPAAGEGGLPLSQAGEGASWRRRRRCQGRRQRRGPSVPQRRPSGEPWGWLRSPPRSRAMVEPYVGGALHPAAWDWPPGAPLCCAAYSPRCFIIQKVRSQPRSLCGPRGRRAALPDGSPAPAASRRGWRGNAVAALCPAHHDRFTLPEFCRAARTRATGGLPPRPGLLSHVNPPSAPLSPHLCRAADKAAVCARIARLRPAQQVLFSRCPSRRRDVWLCVFSSGELVYFGAARSVAPLAERPVRCVCMCVLW
ncbi:hypothetical protein HPB50_015615 [Hyalomma asiaticum]|uniref:Uncharacterized protein n=1 Tax=Hyalomma asiaticum TaxID=266040 RepID=A0ACB7SY98_HYAAI|nr:hypothetical protein HPB50_015615 [Hyalomma asiaticum]